jgi:Ca2+-dependent lipid-binding protein
LSPKAQIIVSPKSGSGDSEKQMGKVPLFKNMFAKKNKEEVKESPKLNSVGSPSVSLQEKPSPAVELNSPNSI